MKLPISIIYFLVFTLASLQSFSQGKIEQSKQEIKKGGKKENISQG
jgi:hypothetical protein